MPPTLPPTVSSERSWPAWRLAVALVSLAMGLALLLPTSVLAQKLETIRIGVASAPVGNPPVYAGNAGAIAHWKGWLDDEFRKDGVKVEWFFFRGAGPAVNEALVNNQLDFAFQGDLPAIVARIVYTSRDDSPIFTRQNHVLVTEAFEKAQPDAVQRVVNVLVRAARWGSDEANREDLLRQWSKAGTPYEAWREDLLGQPLKVRLAPQFDPLLVSLYKDASRQLVKFKLARREVDVDAWIERKYLNRALREQRLETFWPLLDARGEQLPF